MSTAAVHQWLRPITELISKDSEPASLQSFALSMSSPTEPFLYVLSHPFSALHSPSFFFFCKTFRFLLACNNLRSEERKRRNKKPNSSACEEGIIEPAMFITRFHGLFALCLARCREPPVLHVVSRLFETILSMHKGRSGPFAAVRSGRRRLDSGYKNQ